jgi:RimJ/RimL family protein N-acetyltransferase
MSELRNQDDAFTYGDELLLGKRVRLRGTRDDDLPALAAWLMDPAIKATQAAVVLPRSEAATREQVAEWVANKSTTAGFSVETLGDAPELVGHVSLFGMGVKARSATLGIVLGRQFVGRGYGTDAVRVIVSYGFREFGLHRIQLGVAGYNLQGIAAYRKAGFVEEGRRREALLHDGHWYDEVLMSILEQDWRAAATG